MSTPEEKEIERQEKELDGLIRKVVTMEEQIDRLNRIMPHTGETCKWYSKRFCIHADSHYLTEAGTTKKNTCAYDWFCSNDKWELKE